jgi:hypothetical protein
MNRVFVANGRPGKFRRGGRDRAASKSVILGKWERIGGRPGRASIAQAID